jgi:hypothetical protein
MTDWCCAEIRKMLADRIEVSSYYTTITPPLERYTESNPGQNRKRLKDATFLRTWCLDRGTGLPTTTPPTSVHGRLNHLWWGRIPLEDISKHVLIRDQSRSTKLERHLSRSKTPEGILVSYPSYIQGPLHTGKNSKSYERLPRQSNTLRKPQARRTPKGYTSPE